ncbi:DUF1028 domain-containing protein [Natrialbaceae archaeon AArc-T1-2]|uniref:DUF1028 domain-containing protein n=1 Tax=Natrialbaceae archaeon AArc-T1-2 TaxID=3053904 RepID=UPI00255B2B60|nr:DUF1028 domain-containing protein [Natrialbaceae archaeon AArc-T1-2]WIV68563.1 DUF1028 domain-containing protein [Natrialbaceae archaeon AArc-T1-2]
MTFSICVREEYTDETETTQRRFGVAVTTRLAGVGTLCPFASEHGAVATQSLVNVDLGRRGIRYVDEGLAIEDALEALLTTDDAAPQRQLHGVDADGAFAFSGEACGEWYGHRESESYTVAGNLLTGPSVLDAAADAYEAGDESEPLAKRLIDTLAAGHEAGGDKRTELPVQSAAILVQTTESHVLEPFVNDLRIDASEEPIADLYETYELAARSYADTMARYEDAFADDDLEESSDG